MAKHEERSCFVWIRSEFEELQQNIFTKKHSFFVKVLKEPLLQTHIKLSNYLDVRQTQVSDIIVAFRPKGRLSWPAM